MNPGYFGDAGGPIPGFGAQIGGHATAQGQNGNLAKQLSDLAGDSRPPIARTLAHLIDQVNVLEARSASLFERLGPVSRPSSQMESATASKRPEPQCAVDDELLTLVMRIDSVIERIEVARSRLCI